MLTLYRTKECRPCEEIEDRLKDMVLAHDVKMVSPRRLPGELPEDAELPALMDDGQIFEGPEAILDHIDQLDRYRKLWYKYQSDACYCSEDEDVGLD